MSKKLTHAALHTAVRSVVGAKPTRFIFNEKRANGKRRIKYWLSGDKSYAQWRLARAVKEAGFKDVQVSHVTASHYIYGGRKSLVVKVSDYTTLIKRN